MFLGLAPCFSGCIKCAACQGKIVELVGDSPRTDLGVREGGRLPGWGCWEGRASCDLSVAKPFGEGGRGWMPWCPRRPVGSTCGTRGDHWGNGRRASFQPRDGGPTCGGPSLPPPACSGLGGEGSPLSPFPCVGVPTLLPPARAAVLRQPQERLNLDLNCVFMSPV